MPKTQNVLSYPREAWVIPNGSGQLWTDAIFDTELEAKLYVDQYWDKASWATQKHKPIRASVRVTAKPLRTEEPQP